MLVHNAWIYNTDTHAFGRGQLRFEGGMLTECVSDTDTVAAKDGEDVIDAAGGYIVPGLVDVHTHGRIGYDFAEATDGEIRAMLRSYGQDGTTTVIPTIASAPLPVMLQAVRRCRDAGVAGIHIEGRYLSQKRRGAHAPELLSPPSRAEVDLFFEAAGDTPLHFTIAPELDGALEAIRYITARGGTAGIGHSDADYETAQAAEAAGACSYTHLYNCMPPLHHRTPGCIGAALAGEKYIELIADGFHVHPAVLRMTARCSALERLILITDSMSATRCPDGEYAIAGLPVTVKDGKARNAEGNIAGSTITLLDAVRCMMAACALPLADIIPFATENPARMMGLPAVGRLAPGCRADFLIFADKDAKTLQRVVKAGETVFSKA